MYGMSKPAQGVKLYDDGGMGYNPNRESGTYSADDRKKVQKVLKLWDYGNQEYSQFFSRQEQVIDFLADRQWTGEELKYFSRQRRAPLTINIMRTYAMHVMVMQRLTRSDVKVDPVDQNTDPELADIASKLIKHVNHENRKERINSRIFNDGLCGKGDWYIYEDFMEDPLGRVVIERMNPFATVHDPDFIDPRMKDCKWQNVTKYFTAKELKDRFPKAIGNLDFNKQDIDDWWQDLTGVLPSYIGKQETLVDFKNGTYAVNTLFERIFKQQLYMIRNNGEMVGEFPLGRDKVNRFHELYPDIYIIGKQKQYMKRSTVLPYHYTVLEEDIKPYSCYPVIPFVSLRQGQRIPGCTSYNYSMIGLQREVNMRYSNQMDAVVMSLRGGFWIPEDGGKGKILLKRINKDGHKIGQSYVIGNGGEPKPIMSANILGNLHHLEEGAVQYFELVTGLSVQAFGGNDQSGESGVHRQQRREETQTTLYPILDDFNEVEAYVDEATLERKVSQLNIPTAIRIIGDDGTTPEFMQLTTEMIENLKSVQKFDIRIDEGPFNITQKQTELEEQIMLDDITANTHAGMASSLIAPGDKYKKSNLPDGRDIGDAMNARHIVLLGGEGEENASTNDNQTA